MSKIPKVQNLDAYLVVGHSIDPKSKVRAWPTPAHCEGDKVIVPLAWPPEPHAKPNAKVVIKAAPLYTRPSVILMCRCMQEDDRMPIEDQFELVF